MAKVLPKSAYIQLLSVVYKHSMFNKEKGDLIVRYIAFKLIEDNFSKIMVDKLEYDTGIDLGNIITTKPYELVIRQIDKEFKHLELLEIKSLVFDALQSGYHR